MAGELAVLLGGGGRLPALLSADGGAAGGHGDHPRHHAAPACPQPAVPGGRPSAPRPGPAAQETARHQSFPTPVWQTCWRKWAMRRNGTWGAEVDRDPVGSTDDGMAWENRVGCLHDLQTLHGEEVPIRTQQKQKL